VHGRRAWCGRAIIIDSIVFIVDLVLGLEEIAAERDFLVVGVFSKLE
jgi:hypothetical protein